jgi:hypothetical protein
MKTATINLAHLRAVLFAAGKGDIRNYLNGVNVEATGDRVRLVGCDGHRFLMAQSEEARGEGAKDFTVTVPRSVCEAVLKVKFARTDAPVAILREVAAADGPKPGRWTLHVLVGGMTQEFEEVGGRFPDYRRIVPSECTGVTGQFNPEYLHDFAKAAKAMGSRSGIDLHVEHNGSGPALVHFAGHKLLGVVMPYRSAEAKGTPDWFADVAAVEPAELKVAA